MLFVWGLGRGDRIEKNSQSATTGLFVAKKQMIAGCFLKVPGQGWRHTGKQHTGKLSETKQSIVRIWNCPRQNPVSIPEDCISEAS
jgi:hypothetical protein